MEKIRIKYHADIDKVEKISKGDWIDLRVAEDVKISCGQFKMVSLGISMELPQGYEAIVAPRSSFFKNYGCIIANSFGIIDESYKGDGDVWHLPILCLQGENIIPKNTRVAQFRIVKHQPEIDFEFVENLGNDNRGGLGSTGVL